MPGIDPFILALRVMQDREQTEDDPVGAGFSSQSQTEGFNPPPVFGAVQRVRAQDEHIRRPLPDHAKVNGS